MQTLVNTLLPFADFCWILQKEEYETARYAYWLRRFFWRRNFVVSERLVYTARVKVTLGVAAVLFALGVALLAVSTLAPLAKAAGLVLALSLIPAIVLLANALLAPVFAFAHARVRRQAAAKVAAHAPMRVIAIAGSYGKTTTKHLLYELVRHTYRTQMTPGTINTTAGIADWLLHELAPGTELLILEMDAYHRGEIAASCRMAPPDIAIITTIGEQHLARFKSHESLQRAIGEVVAEAKPGALIFADAATMAQVQPFAEAGSRVWRTVDTSRLAYGDAELAAKLSSSNRENAARALAVAEHLGIPAAFAADALQKFELPERRQQVTKLYGYEAVDDSFNISLATARAGLAAARALADARGKKLVVVAAGIPELGPEQSNGNIELGRALAQSADHTAVLGTMFARELEQGLATAPHTRHPRLGDFVAKGHELFPPAQWLLLLEPALPDLYY